MNFQPSAEVFAPEKPGARPLAHRRHTSWSTQAIDDRRTAAGGRNRLLVWFTGGRYVSTDNTSIHAAKLMVSSDVSGIVSDVLVHEGQTVRQGDIAVSHRSRTIQNRARQCKGSIGADRAQS